MPQDDEETRERAKRKGRRGSISAECSTNPLPPEIVLMQTTESGSSAQETANPLLCGRVAHSRYPPTVEEQQLIKSRLSSHFLFSSIQSPETWNEILASMDRKDVQVGDTVIEQDSLDAEYLYVVHSGIFRVWLNGDMLDFAYSEPGSCFGELALMYQCPRQATVRCVEGPGVLWMLDRLTFKRVLFKGESKKYKGEAFLPALKKNWSLRANLSDFELEKVADVMNLEEYPATDSIEGNLIIQQGDAQYARMKFYVVLAGTVLVTKRGGVRVRTLTTGDYFGERSLLERIPRTASVSTDGNPARLGTLEWSNFDRLLRKPCLKTFIQRIESGYERTRYSFLVDGVRFGTNLAYLSGRRFETNQDYFSFMNSLSSSDDDLQRGFWVTGERFPTRVPALMSRSFPSVEAYVEFLCAGFSSAAPSPAGKSKQMDSPKVVPSEEKALATAKRRGRRGSVSGDSSSAGVLLASSPKHPLSVDTELKVSLKKHFLFTDLDDSELMRLASQMVEQRYKFGEYVIMQNDEQTEFFYVVKQGTFVVEKDRLRLENVTYGSGSAFGELALMYFCPRAASVLCLSPSASVYALNRDAFRAVLIGLRSTRRDLLEGFLKEKMVLFAEWPNDAIARVADVAQEVEFCQGDVVIRQNDADFASMRIYFVQNGQVEVAVDGEVVRTIQEGGYFGERAIVERAPRSATCTAKSQVLRCLALDVPAFERLLGPFKDVLRGKFQQYHVPANVLDTVAKPNKYVQPTGWFRVGRDVFRTNIGQLNCKIFVGVPEYYEFLCMLKTVPGNDEDDEESYVERVYSFMVGANAYPTRVPALVGKRFTTVEQYVAYLNDGFVASGIRPGFHDFAL